MKRGLKYPMFEVYDLPDLNITCERRGVSTVPTQALTMLNNEFFLIQADHLARRVLHEAVGDPRAQIRTLYRIALSREPDEKELTSNLAFLQNRSMQPAGSLGALTDLADVVLNLNEFVYVH
jgi:hypothetical protein